MTDRRWAQLTYASFDTGLGTSGGWQVKETSGELSEIEVERVKARVVTLFDSTEVMPQYPTPGEIAALPRRLAYVPLDGLSHFGYWHAVPCGLDGTGRPGNVFSHVLVDREPDEMLPALRPVDLWRSGFWVTPFGQPEVLAAMLQSPPDVRPGQTITAAAIVDFLLDPAVWRGAILATFLDAVLEAVRGGSRVILATATADTAALWVGAASHLMPPQASRGVGFSLLERAGGIEAAVGRGALVVGIPYSDVEAAAKLENIVVIDDRVSPAMGDLGGEPHRFGSYAVPVTPWSVIAQVAFQEPDLALAVLRSINTVSERLTGPVTPTWPIAMTVALMPEVLADASAEAFQVLRDESPADLQSYPELWDAASALAREHFGTTTDQAWAQVEASASAGGVVHQLALAVYQERAIGDSQWLLREGGVPAVAQPAEPSLGESTLRKLGEHLGELLTRASAGENVAVEALRIGDYAVRSGLVAGADGASIALERLLVSTAVPLLRDQLGGPALVASAGPVAEDLLAGWIRPGLEVDMPPGDVGYRFGAGVLPWLYPSSDTSLLDESGNLGELALESVIERAVKAEPSYIPYRVAAVIALVDRGDRFDGDRIPHLVSPTRPWSAAEVVGVEAVHPGTLPVGTIAMTLRTDLWGSDLEQLTQNIATSRPDVTDLIDIAALRRVGHQVVTTYALSFSDALFVRDTTKRLLSSGSIDPAIRDLGLTYFAACFAIALAHKRDFYFERLQADLFSRYSQGLAQTDLVGIAASFVASGLVSSRDLPFVVAQLLHAQAEPPLASSRTWFALATFPAKERPNDRSFLAIVADTLAAHAGGDIDELLIRALSEVKMAIPPTYDPKQADKIMSDFERFARPTLKHLKSLDDGNGRGRSGVRNLFSGFGSTSKENS